MDIVTLQRFLRGQCCPSCEPRDDRRNLNEGLIRIGPSLHAMEQAQKLGMRTDRFPYFGEGGIIRFQDLWSTSAKSVVAAKEWWFRIRDSIEEINPDFVPTVPEGGDDNG